tara:strand:- start:935 stop:1132 length:198 start_codon:yes stop_codon:yes gene_type:complete
MKKMTKINKKKYAKEILDIAKVSIEGYDNLKLILNILSQFEIEIQLYQCEENKNMVQGILNSMKE